MADNEETLLEFPCTFAVKALGASADDFESLVHAIVANHVDDLPLDATRSRPSAKGNYTSVTVTFTARSKAQLDAIYRSLTAHNRIKMAI
ncbi:MAG: DUF493 domain-containing protein [Pseudomonadota bacterium]